MKKYLAVICCATLLSLVGFVAVKAGYYTGPNNSLYVTANAGVLWIEGTLANDSAQHYKKIYAQAGTQGSWSSLVAPSVHSVTQKDTRAIWEEDIAFLNPCWKVSSSDVLTCRS